MSWLDGVRDRLRWLTRSGDAETQLDAELEFHVDMETERLMGAGLEPEEARRSARRALGNAAATREAVRDQSGVAWLDDLRRDLAYAARGLRKRPGFAFAAVATLALGIGANTAVFSVVEGVVLRPLAYQEPDRLVAVWADRFVSIRETRTFREQTRTLSSIAAYAPWRMALTEVEEPTQVMTARTSANLFTTLGVRAELGRTYAPGEDQPGAARVAVIGHSLWHTHFGGDSAALGRTITLDGVAYEIVGVMPRTFEVLSGDAAVWVPLPEDPEEWYYRSGVSLLLGRLRPGTTVAAAQADLARVLQVARERLEMPERYGEGAAVVELQEYLTGDYRTLLLVLLGAAGGILLLAGANLANLLLARATSRRPEMAMRIALGARRSRLLRQVLTEGLGLSALGAGAGVLLAWLMLRVFTGVAPDDMPRVAEIGLNGSVLLVSTALALAMGAVFGLAQDFIMGLAVGAGFYAVASRIMKALNHVAR